MTGRKKIVNVRSFTSFLSLWTFIVLAVSGISLYFSPRGRIANWTDWSLAGLTKEGWAGLHIIVALLFLLTIIIHIYLNWNILICYMKDRYQQAITVKRELILSLLVAGIFCIGAVNELFPFWMVMDWNKQVKNYWERPVTVPPVPHIEEKTLREVAEMRGEQPDELIRILAEHDVEVLNVDETLADIADRYKISPQSLYSYLDRTQQTDAHGRRGGNRSGTQGRGFGRMTIEQLASSHGVDLSIAIERLQKAGIEAVSASTIRDLADTYNKRPYEIEAFITGKEVKEH